MADQAGRNTPGASPAVPRPSGANPPDLPLRLLPEVMRRTALPGSPLAALLSAMGALQDPAEAVISDIGSVFSAWRTPEVFLPYLASWLDLDRYLRPGPDGPATVYPAGVAALRGLVARTSALGRGRGTAASLQATLELACGLSGFSLQENVTAGGQPRSFHLLVVAPAAAQAYAELVGQLVATEKPVFLTHEIVYAPPPFTLTLPAAPEKAPAADEGGLA